MYLYIYWPRQKQFIFQNAPDNILPYLHPILQYKKYYIKKSICDINKYYNLYFFIPILQRDRDTLLFF